MQLGKDLREFIELFLSNEVEFLVVGAHALAFHGRSRYTGDLDLWVRATEANARRIENALGDFGFASTGLRAKDFLEPDAVIQLGQPPLRIDLLTGITGVTFDDAWSRRVTGRLDGLDVSFIDRELLIRNKRAVGRPQDLADVEYLEE
jgi:hypothetical protein